MNVLIANPYSCWGLHLAADLEIAEKHIFKGDKVIYLICNAELTTCYANPYHNALFCLSCKSQRRKTLKVFPHKIQVLSYSDLLNDKEIKKIKDAIYSFSDKDELKKLCIDNYDIGYETLSTVISVTRNPDPDLNKVSDLTNACIKSGLIAYYSTLKAIEKYNISLAYLFNGRFVPMRGIRRAIEQKKIPYYTHERAYDLKKYSLVFNTTPHDFDYISRQINKYWSDDLPIKDKVAIAEKFYLEKSTGKDGFNFVKKQEFGVLPESWNPSKKNITIFLTSEDEFEAIHDSVKLSIYEHQLDALKKIIGSLQKIPSHNLHLYVRCHPNMSPIQAQQFQHLVNEFVTVINPDEKISTYSLVKNSSSILSFGSTVGIEAVYYGIPSILVTGKSAYEKLGGTYQPNSHEDLMSLLLCNLSPMDKTPAYKYGYYMKSSGIPYKHYVPHDIVNGCFYGKVIKPSAYILFLIKILSYFKVALKKSRQIIMKMKIVMQ